MNLYHQIDVWLLSKQHQQVHRQLLIISGPESWAIEQGINLTKSTNYLWVGNSPTCCKQINNQQYQDYLGQEFELVVINCFSGFRANAAIALSGTITAGGLMVIICPTFDNWPTFEDPDWLNRVSYGYAMQKSHFIDKFIASVNSDKSVAVLTPEGFKGEVCAALNEAVDPELISLKALQEQQVAINSIIKVATGHRNRPLVLSADRGRGKSSALGLAAAQLIRAAGKKIVIVAPSPKTVQQVFKHAGQSLPDAKISKNKLSLGAGYLQFVAPDAILTADLDIDLLLIDEAAALPAHLLFTLIDRFSRIVFSTTLHGYEGSGRGFDLRVKHYLNSTKPGWRSTQLSQAMRWYNGDTLESFWFDLLCIKGKTLPANKGLQDPVIFSHVTKAVLANDSELSYTIFQLLIDAHYQTSPDDLIRLLDSPEQHCYILRKDNEVMGVALLIEEGGGLLNPLHIDIASGKRRVKGHLVAQNIAFHYAQPEFSQLNQLRITRLAISANYQGQGLGSALLAYLTQEAKTQGKAFLTTSFGVNQKLLRFWQQAGFTLVNLSKKPETSSAQHSAQLLMPLNQSATKRLQAMVTEFSQEVIYQSDKAYQTIEPVVLHLILQQLTAPPTQTKGNQPIVTQFVQATRPLNLCKRQLRDHYLSQIDKFNNIDKTTINILISVLLQNQSEVSVAKSCGLSTPKDIERIIRQSFGSIFSLV
ncbi:GNAT family N-acetyltransferase [Paraglaciecola sp.]|uniref:tRNA(Met) cytidine acetyltransferase TmcA n=1 Tax=Paraglaciecola sp. TaxID=1920173 RepID=UPI0030F4714E